MLVHFLAHFVLAVSDSDDFAELGEEKHIARHVHVIEYAVRLRVGSSVEVARVAKLVQALLSC